MCLSNAENNACEFEIVFVRDHQKLPTDPNGRCIFHSTDIAWKRESKAGSYFRSFIELASADNEVQEISIVGVTLTGDSNLIIDCRRMPILKNLNLRKSIIHDSLDFQQSSFNASVDFFRNEFKGTVFFQECTFNAKVTVNNCQFIDRLNFNEAIFNSSTTADNVSFTESDFYSQANFPNVKFNGPADLNIQLAHFRGNVYFTGSFIERHSIFDGTIFRGTADFRNTTFKNGIQFNTRNGISVQFNKEANFENSVLGKASFVGIHISDKLNFKNSKFGSSDFIGLSVAANSSMNFEGNEKNKIFGEPVNFDIDPAKIEGHIEFKSVRVGNIHPDHLTVLNKLQESGKVFYNEECEFENHIGYYEHKIDGPQVEYDVVRNIFQNLENWIYAFVNPIFLKLSPITDKIAENVIAIKVQWKRDEDFLLYRRLARYYFDSITAYGTKKGNELIDKIINSEEFGSQFHDSEVTPVIIRTQLLKIIDNVCSDIDLRYNKKIGSETSSNRTNSRFILNRDNLDNVTQYVNEFLSGISKFDLDANSFIQIAGDSTPNFSLPLILIQGGNIDNSINITTGDIKSGDRSPIVLNSSNMSIGISNGEDSEMFCRQLESIFEKIKEEGTNAARKDDVALIELALKAAKENDEKKSKNILKSVGSWVIDAATQVGAGVVVAILTK